MPLEQRDAETGRDRRVLQHVRQADARRATRSTCASSATRSPAAAPTSTRRSSRSTRCTKHLDPGACATSPSPQTGLGAASSARSSARPARSRPSPSSRARCSSTSRRRSTRSRRSRGRILQDTISGGPRDARRGDPLVPDPAAVPRQHGRLLPRAAARARARCASAAPPLADAFDDRHAAGCAAPRRSTSAGRHALRRSRRSRRTRRCRSGSTACAAPSSSLTPTIATSPRAQTQLQLPGAAALQRREHPVRRRHETGQLAARSSRSATPAGPNSEVGPASAPANGPDGSAQPPARQPVPARRRAGPGRHLHGRQREVHAPARP